MGASVEPSKAALQGLNQQFFLGQIFLIDGGYLQLATGRWLDVLGNLYHAVGIEIETHHSIV